MPVNHTSLTLHSLLYQTNLPLDHSPHQMTIFRIERLSPIETQKHCISNSLKYNASLHFLYRPIDIITLLCDIPLGVTVSIKKEASSLFTHYCLPILLILFTSLRLRQVFHFKHNLCFPDSLLHTT